MENFLSNIKTRGYCVIPNVFPLETMEKALELVAGWYEKTANKLPESIPFLARTQPMVYNLQNKDMFFVNLLFGSELMEKILTYFLNDTWYKQIPQDQPNYILRSFVGRTSKGALPLHIDSCVPYLGDYVYSIQCSIILQDQSAANGCTLVVPGSHLSGRYVEDQGVVKDAIPIESKAGDVVVWDSRLWHGATANETGQTRWALIATYGRWWLKQVFNITQNIPAEIYSQLTDKQKSVLGFCSVPYEDEFQGIDMRRGYAESFKPSAAT